MKQADDDIYIKALNYAYRLLSYRPRSQQELGQRLERKNFSPEVIQEIMELLKEKHYLDDLAFAQFWVNSRFSAKPIGKKLLKMELHRKGISSSIQEQVLAQFEGQFNEIELASQTALKRREVLKKDTRLSPEKIKKRIADYLARRGFSYETIMEVLQDIHDHE